MGNEWRPIASGGDIRNLCRVLVSSEASSPGPGRPGNKGMGGGPHIRLTQRLQSPAQPLGEVGPENSEGVIARTRGTARYQLEARPCE